MILTAVSPSTSSTGPRPGDERLTIRELSVSFGRQPVLVDVSLKLAQAQFVTLLGPNGAGKSTLLRAILGLLPAVRGTVEVDGRPIRRQLDHIAYVPQRESVNWEFPVSVGDVALMGRYRRIGFLGRASRADREAVDRALDQVGMLALRNRQIGELSGGQQQRAFLARCLAQEASILLLDEPLAGVDATSSEMIVSTLRRLTKAGMLVLMATHDFGLAASQADLVILLHRSIAAIGKPSEVLRRATLQRVYGSSVFVIEEEQRPLVLVGDDPHGH